MVELSAEIAHVKALAAEAAGLALERAANVAPREKANASFVTDLDLDMERLIRDRLRAAFPHDTVTGEEHAPEGPESPRRWSIDPIDGTGNLVHGLPLWAISIGLMIDGDPSLGVIALPALGELYWAAKGQGAWRGSERLSIPDADDFHSQDNIGMSTNALRKIDPRTVPGRLRDFGSACCDQAFLAGGRLRASIFLGEHAHDLAAGSILVAEAGGRFATIEGESLSAADVLARTPLRQPIIMAPPRRLAALAGQFRRF